MLSIEALSEAEFLRAQLRVHDALSGITAMDELLREISAHTRELMATDMAYVSSTDFDSNETMIRQGVGIATDAYSALRQALGTGVLGRVAIGHSPFWTADYLNDVRLQHVPEVDQIVADEGVRGILAVPLSRAGQVLGALVVAERKVRHFTTAEIDRLGELGRLVSQYLFNLRERISMLQELGEAQLHRTVLEEKAQQSDLNFELDRRLLGELTARTTPDHARLLDAASSILGVNLWFEISRDEIVGMSPASGTEAGERYEYPLIALGERLGVLCADSLENNRVHTGVERTGVYLVLSVLLQRAQLDAEFRRESQALLDLIEQRLPVEELRATFDGRFGVTSKPLHCVSLAAPKGQSRVLMAALQQVKSHSSVVAPHGEHVCVLTKSADWEAKIRKVFEGFGWRLQAGAARPVGDLADVPDAHRESEMALSALLVLGQTGVRKVGDMGVLAAFFDLQHRGELPASLTATADALIEHDREHRAELALTAQYYFRTDENIGRVADIMSVHRNTIRQRLARIGEILGEDWNTFPRKVEVQLALWAKEAAGELDHG